MVESVAAFSAGDPPTEIVIRSKNIDPPKLSSHAFDKPNGLPVAPSLFGIEVFPPSVF